MRVRVPAGQLGGPGLLARQVIVLADLARRYGGTVELTVRQQVQIRGVPPPALPGVLEELGRAGLTTLQTDGPHVRNVTGCPLAGLDAGELLDAGPLLHRVAEAVLRPRLLPHKLNVALTACRHNCVRAEIQDLAFLPHLRGKEAGFTVWAGGHLGRRPRLARPLGVFLLPDEVVPFLEAVLSLFAEADLPPAARLGDLLDEAGPDGFLGRVENRLGATLRRLPEDAAPRGAGPWEDHLGVWPQRQPGLCAVGLAVPGGAMAAADFLELARLARSYGSGRLRLTQGKHVVLVDVPAFRLAALLEEPLLLRLSAEPTPEAGLLTCPGKPLCPRAHMETGSRMVELARRLAAALPPRARPLRLHVSACEAGCGQHLVGEVGLVARAAAAAGTTPAAATPAGDGRPGKGEGAGEVTVDVYARTFPGMASLPVGPIRTGLPVDSLEEVLPALIRRLLSEPEPDPATAAPLLISHLQTFCRAAECGSLTRAARDLSLSQPAASKHLLALETALGIPLLERNAGGCHLTPAGRVAYRHARHVLAACARLARDLEPFRREGR